MLRILLGTALTLALTVPTLARADDPKDDASAKKPTPPSAKRRPSDVVYLLIEMSDADEEAVAELQQLYNVLRKLDKNNDGKLDPAELKTVRQQVVDDRVQRIFDKLDRDQDGKISKAEAQGRILEHFDRLDRNSDGFITTAELRVAITERPQASTSEKNKSVPAQP